jgi:hypothetical protein
MAQSGWRLPDELLRRVRVRCAEEGVRQNVWVERALEKALGDSSTAEQLRKREPISQVAGSTPATPAPSRTSATVSAFDAQSEAMKRQARMNKAKGL